MKNSDSNAFPIDSPNFNGPELGLTKREYFAAMAMQGLCAKPRYDSFKNIAAQALFIADALLKELERDK